MTKTVEFYFDVGSPTAYLAYKRLLQLNEQYKCSIKYHPILLGGIFKATGNNSPIMVPAKGRYMDMDMHALLYECTWLFVGFQYIHIHIYIHIYINIHIHIYFLFVHS